MILWTEIMFYCVRCKYDIGVAHVKDNFNLNLLDDMLISANTWTHYYLISLCIMEHGFNFTATIKLNLIMTWPIQKQIACALTTKKTKHDNVIKWKYFPRYWPFVRGMHQWPGIPHTKASDRELWCFLWSAPEWTVGKESGAWWFEMPSCSLWCHCSDLVPN